MGRIDKENYYLDIAETVAGAVYLYAAMLWGHHRQS